MPRHPGKILPTLLPLLIACLLASSAAAVEPDRWEAAIAAFETQDRQSPPPQSGIVFVGSSSIGLWDLKQSFPNLPVVNRGFGGSQIADSVRYVDRIVLPCRPKVIVFYAGDNDVSAGKSPERVANDFKAFAAKVHAALPQCRIVFIGIKPSTRRWALVDKMREANRLVREFTGQDDRLRYVDTDAPMIGPDGKPRTELFRSDGLHLSAEGYRLWADLVRPHLNVAEKKTAGR